jgi:DNA-binding transcriptional LysR family regulator
VSAGLDELAAMALFAHVVQARSFTGAAERVGIAKSAVSRRIALLEAKLGVRLLLRSTRKLSLTTDGARFYEHCSAILAAAQAANESMSLAGRADRGTIRINAPVTFSELALSRALALFLAQHPELEIQLTADDGFVDVIEGGFDLVIRMARLNDSSLVAKKLAEDRLVVCGAPAYLGRAGTPQVPADLVHHNCLHYARVELAAEWRFRGPNGPYVVPARNSFSANSGSVLREACVAGLGLAVLPSFMVAEDVARGRLALVLEGQRRARVGIYAVFAARRQVPPRVRSLLRFLGEHFARHLLVARAP